MFRISLLLWLIALAALNLALLKYCETLIEIIPNFAGLIGLMPLFAFFVLSAYLAMAGRFRFAVVRRQVRKRFVDSAALVSGAIVAAGTLSCLLFTQVVLQLIALLFSPLEQWIGGLTLSPETERFVFWALLEALVSGPLIFVTFILSWVHSRFRLEITRLGTNEQGDGGVVHLESRT